MGNVRVGHLTALTLRPIKIHTFNFLEAERNHPEAAEARPLQEFPMKTLTAINTVGCFATFATPPLDPANCSTSVKMGTCGNDKRLEEITIKDISGQSPGPVYEEVT